MSDVSVLVWRLEMWLNKTAEQRLIIHKIRETGHNHWLRVEQMWLSIHVEHTESKNDRRRRHETCCHRGAHDEPMCQELKGNDRQLQEGLCVVQPAPRSCCYAPAHIPSRCQHEEDHSLAQRCACVCCVHAHARVRVCRWWHIAFVLFHIWKKP